MASISQHTAAFVPNPIRVILGSWPKERGDRNSFTYCRKLAIIQVVYAIAKCIENYHCGAIVARTVPNNSKMRDKIPNYPKNRGGSNPKKNQPTPNNPKLNQKVAHCSHNPKVGGSNPPPATIRKPKHCGHPQRFLFPGKCQQKCAPRGAEMAKKGENSPFGRICQIPQTQEIPTSTAHSIFS